MDATSTMSIFDTFLDNVGANLLHVIPLVLAIGAALIGLAFGIRWVKRWIGRGK